MTCKSVDRPFKVVWLCHLSTREIVSRLKLVAYPQSEEIAPWISNTIESLKQYPEIELFVVAPFRGLKTTYQTITIDTVQYYLFKPYDQVFNWDTQNAVMRKIRTLLNMLIPINRWFNYPINSMRVNRIINTIKPDIIHLHGAENPYYSSAVLQFKNKFPIVITIQGFISHTTDKVTTNIRNSIKIEKKIIKQFTHFGVRTEQMRKDVQDLNPNAKFFWLNYTTKKLDLFNEKKRYDIIFFARLCKDKGIEDLILALRLVKAEKKDVSLALIGSNHTLAYTEFIKRLAYEHQVEDNINWLGYQVSQQDLFRLVSSARISVLPTYHDVIPGTIIESMQLGLPVVSYKTGSIPELNETEENVLLVDKGDIKGLAKCIIRLLTDDDLYNIMSQRGIKCIKDRLFLRNIHKQHLDCYHAVIEDFNTRVKK